jgi:hypothetical protein
MNKLIATATLILIFSCSASKKASKSESTTSSRTNSKSTPKAELRDNQTFELKEISTDVTYGSKDNPVEVGGNDKHEGPLNERRFLNALAGPNGETISYYRRGSCCPVKSDNGFMGYAMLDNYRVTWEGSKDTVSIFINMYDYGVLKAPVGFTIKQ